MPLLLIVGLIAVFVYLWFARRNSTLGPECRWRLDRSGGPAHYRCASCGAVVDQADGRAPRDCLKPRGSA
jgi:tRNA(Ile2) C34 agmatinyltransferase TiaS